MSELLTRLGPEGPLPQPCGGPAWRRVARSAALSISAAAERLRTPPSGGTVQILLLHHVRPDEEAAFRSMLEAAARTHTLVSYDEAVRRITNGRRSAEQALAVSFDDGLTCNAHAASVLEEFGVRGAFFVCPPVHDETSDAVLARFCRERLRHEPVEFLDWSGVEALHEAGHTIGGHTQSHVDLGAVSAGQAADETGRCFDVIKRRLGRAEHFAWPYGTMSHITNGAADEVFAAGFTSCASGVRGAHATSGPAGETSGPLLIRRESVEANWPLSHIKLFLRRSARQPIARPAVGRGLSARRAA